MRKIPTQNSALYPGTPAALQVITVTCSYPFMLAGQPKLGRFICDAGYYSAECIATSAGVSGIGTCEVPMLLATVRPLVFGIKCCELKLYRPM